MEKLDTLMDMATVAASAVVQPIIDDVKIRTNNIVDCAVIVTEHKDNKGTSTVVRNDVPMKHTHKIACRELVECHFKKQMSKIIFHHRWLNPLTSTCRLLKGLTVT